MTNNWIPISSSNQLTNVSLSSMLNTAGIHGKSTSRSLNQFNQQQQQHQQHQPQHLIIQPIEFDYRHRNFYGYLALGTFVLVLINYIMLKERSCQISLANGYQNFDTIQGFHMTVLMVSIIVFILSYFNFALVIADFKLLFYATTTLLFACAAFLVYDAIAIVSAPCVSASFISPSPFIALFDSSLFNSSAKNIFVANDGIGITVFVFDIVGAFLIFMAGRTFYQKC